MSTRRAEEPTRRLMMFVEERVLPDKDFFRRGAVGMDEGEEVEDGGLRTFGGLVEE